MLPKFSPPSLAVFPAIASLLLLSCSSNTQSTTEQVASKEPIVCYTPKTDDKEWYTSGKKAPKFENLHGINFTITTKNPEAQEFFNQGLMLAYGFNHAEAARSFFEASRLDSTCAMAYWGFAYVLGPNYNGGMEEDNFERAYEAARKAERLSGNCTPKEVALIKALTKRYAADPPEDRSALDVAYAEAMKEVYRQFSSDPDIGALYAESIMDLHPWDLYDKDTKAPKQWTPEIVATLEHLMKRNPNHPGAHHFYIHAMEASASPEKAMLSAALLDSLVRGSGHLVHMPSHIYINTGDYHLGSLANMYAVQVDSVYTTTCHAQGAYPLAYYPHNYHFLTATATLEGNSKLAWEAAKKLHEHTSEEIMRMPGWGTLQHYYSIPYYVAVKLSIWDEILSLPAPGEDLVYPSAIWRYARGMAYLGKNDLENARKEASLLKSLAADSTLKDLTIWDLNTTEDLVNIASKVLTAGIAVKENRLNDAITLLKEAVVIEDALNYNEPPDWFFSVRHDLGAVLLKAGKAKEAEQVYRDDLKIWPKNGWALVGLYNALSAQNKKSDAEMTKAKFEEAWKFADFSIASSSVLN